jgi:hypothetical protein
MLIFEQSTPLPIQTRLKINREATWYTWSRDFRGLFKFWKKEVEAAKRPISIHLLGGKLYDDTYSLEVDSITDRTLLRDLIVFANDLYNLEITDQLILFRNMLDEDLSGRNLHFLFAFFRDTLVSCSNDPFSALSQPISRALKQGKEFPLHSDLYIPVILFNIFDDVDTDNSGASIFLPVSAAVELLSQVKELPPQIKQQITDNLTQVHDKDCYEEAYNLLHGWEHPWTQDIERRMIRRQLRVKLFSGQGYMLHDRKWLHGRERIAGKLSHKRLHRLVFNTKQAQLKYEELTKSHCRTL